MADNKTKIDRLHELLPAHFNSDTNENWSALVAALGDADQQTADLVSEVRKQFFVKTASRPYLDRLAANNKIARPRLVGMDDPSFREYIPVLSYKPKQVKLIVDQLLDIFFFKESTTAFTTTQNPSPFAFEDGWELSYTVDEQFIEGIKFSSADFTNIAVATANEIVAAINRQAKFSYATSYYDSITKSFFIKLFSKTIGSKGSLRITGGRANVALRFSGFIANAGNGSNTQWTVSKIGDLTSFQHTGGTSPSIDKLQAGDIAIINLAGNIGSYPLKNVDVSAGKIDFINLFSTPGVFTQTSDLQVKFIRPEKFVAYTNNRRAMTWETSSGEIVVEMPTSPPVVKRSLQGSYHLNGEFSTMASRDSSTAMTIVDASNFPESGTFMLELKEEIVSRWLTPTENTVSSFKTNSRLQYQNQKYQYTSRVALATTGTVVQGSNVITNLASVAGLALGQDVIMDGVPAHAKIVALLANTATVSAPATSSIPAGNVKFLGNALTGITPDLPTIASLNEFNNSSISRTGGITTVTTASPHGFKVGELVIVDGSDGILITSTTGDTNSGSSQLTSLASTVGISPGMLVSGAGIPVGSIVTDIVGSTVTMSSLATATAAGVALNFSENTNVTKEILTVTSTTYTFSHLGTDGSPTVNGVSRVERKGMAASGSKVIVTSSTVNDISRILGAYIWDQAAPFVLSSEITTITDPIKAGTIVRLLNVNSADIPAGGGFLIFDYGLNTQEGPVRYLYKPTSNTIALDPSYVFQKAHLTSSSVVALRNKGPHVMSTRGTEYPPYITNPSEARFILESLIRSVKSSGIFVNFLVRFPEQLYATLDVYDSGVDPG